ncbi:MAG TPA: competence/damage-inducible protein A [Candidatus Acidoferrum sp.]|nr:competence/damage-inducible protein A [Candidatus Acidoferrum sp.]
MNIEIINTGSELMLGLVLNTHQQWLCRRLADFGHVVTRQVAVADAASEIQQAVRESLGRAGLVITTGGLGPTSDDITRELIAELLGKKLIENPAVLAHIEHFFAARNRPRPARTTVESLVPEGAAVFLNQYGTAPGLAMKVDPNPFSAGRKAAWLIMLPGPPRELRPMFDQSVFPFLQRELAGETFVCRTLRSTGIGESIVQEMVEGHLLSLMKTGLGVGYCARPGAVDVRLTASGAQAPETVRAGETIVRNILGPNIYGWDDDEIESVVVAGLTQRKQTLALAESCTGGLIANRVTNVPGASVVFKGGVVSYSDGAKESFLDVRPETLRAEGAVSTAVAREMAAGARRRFGADYALGVTGIAGPGGGTPGKPVGTVFIALATAAGIEVNQKHNPWDRETFKQVTAQQALEMLRRQLILRI